MAAEKFGEKGRVLKMQSVGNLGNRLLGSLQQMFRFLDRKLFYPETNRISGRSPYRFG